MRARRTGPPASPPGRARAARAALARSGVSHPHHVPEREDLWMAGQSTGRPRRSPARCDQSSAPVCWARSPWRALTPSPLRPTRRWRSGSGSVLTPGQLDLDATPHWYVDEADGPGARFTPIRSSVRWAGGESDSGNADRTLVAHFDQEIRRAAAGSILRNRPEVSAARARRPDRPSRPRSRTRAHDDERQPPRLPSSGRSPLPPRRPGGSGPVLREHWSSDLTSSASGAPFVVAEIRHSQSRRPRSGAS